MISHCTPYSCTFFSLTTLAADIECKHPFTIECDNWCRDRLCKIGPLNCRKGGNCAFDYGCDGSNAERDTTAELSSRNTEAALAYYEEVLNRRDQEPEEIKLEPDQAAGCTQCSDWMKNCKRTQCARPWAPECQWDCQAKLCKDGPSECHKGGSCAVPAHCGRKSNSLTAPDPPAALRVRDGKASNGWPLEECIEYIAGCIHSFCRQPLHTGPDCEQACQNTLCNTLHQCCKVDSLKPPRSVGSV